MLFADENASKVVGSADLLNLASKQTMLSFTKEYVSVKINIMGHKTELKRINLPLSRSAGCAVDIYTLPLHTH